MEAQSRKVPAFTVMGLALKTSNDHPEQIGKLWGDFLAKGGAKQISGRQGDDVYAVYFAYAGDHTKPFTLLLGCRVPDAITTPPGMTAVVVPAGTYALFEAKGPVPASVVATWQEIWKAPVQRAFSTDFERHRGPESVDIHIAVK